jgi:hypothetical protein
LPFKVQLAHRCAEVAEMTNKAMGGGIAFRDALEMRLQVRGLYSCAQVGVIQS